LNANNQGFEASLFHPDFGNEVVHGRIFIDRWNVQFRSESVSEEIPVEGIEIEFEESTNRICFHDPLRPEVKIFTTNQSILKHPSLQRVTQVQSQISHVLGRRELKRALKLTAYFLIACVVVTWLGSVSVSFMVRTIAAGVPMQWEEKFGAEEIAKLRKEGRLIDDTNQIAQLMEVAQPLIKVLPANRRNLKFYILDDDEPNAFALPGEHVVVHSGLLRMAETQEELLGVLAHELAHETQRHLIRESIASRGTLAVFGVFVRGRQATGSALGMGSGFLVTQGFSQRYEAEADAVGWKYLVAANIDPRGMISMFKKLQAEEGIERLMPQSLASHPALSTRIATLEKNWQKLNRTSGFLELPPVKWELPKVMDEQPKLPFTVPATRPDSPND
jgi:beta-barrel assembly-enhancing protease